MENKRRVYDKEFKLMAVNLCLSGKSAKEVGMDLGIDPHMLNRWKREHAKYGENTFSGNGKPLLTDSEKEIYRLKIELREMQIERDILKKAVSIFSRSDSKNTGL